MQELSILYVVKQYICVIFFVESFQLKWVCSINVENIENDSWNIASNWEYSNSSNSLSIPIAAWATFVEFV